MSDPAASETVRRRSLLTTRPNPRQNLDYLVRLEARQLAPPARIEIYYVPDRLILAPEALATYTAALGDLPRRPLEELAITILEDVSDELVPRWARVMVALEAPPDGVGAHVVMLEERQPNWSNDDLLAPVRAV
jgi:hypothetical protein